MKILDIINRYSFVTTWSDEDLVCVAYCLEIPSVKAHGLDIQTAVSELKTALLITLEWMMEDNESIPTPFQLQTKTV
jgi:predicted RNase H-like HicB family nuclease